MATFLRAPRTGNAVADPNALKAVTTNGQNAGAGPTVASIPRMTRADLTPPLEPAHQQFLPSRFMNPSMVPAIPEASGISKMMDYLSVPGAPKRDVTTLFHARPPTSMQFPRAVDSNNILATPPRAKGVNIFRIFSRPRSGAPGNNPGGVNTTSTA